MTEQNESAFNENEEVNEETSQTDSVENNDETTETSQDNLQEDDSQEIAEDVDPKDEEIQQLKKDVQENEEKYLGACSYDCAKHERNRYVARHHISNEEWQRRLNNFKDVPEHTHA